MSKTFKIYLVLFVIILIVMGLFQVNKKPILDWRKNFDVDKKSPFGLFIFSQEAAELLDNKLDKIFVSPYKYYTDHPQQENHNIIIIEKNWDRESWTKILTQVKNGSDALIFSTNLPNKMQDSLKFSTGNFFGSDTYYSQLTDVKFKNDNILLNRLPDHVTFTDIDKNHEILGFSTVKPTEKPHANFIKINYGKGHLFLHSEPLITTNYYLLKGNTKYIEDVFSYLPKRKTMWFIEKEEKISSSPIRFILDNPPLRYAWYLLISGLLVFVIFNIKRKQRIVPIIEPLKNTSLDFVRSIGNLYLQEGDFHDMMAKKAQYFLNKVRMDYLIDTSKLDDDFITKLHHKTGKSQDQIKEAIVLIKKAQDPYANVMSDDLAKINTLLDHILT